MEDRLTMERWAMACCEGGFPQKIRVLPDGSWRTAPAPSSWEQVKIAWKAHQVARTDKYGWTWDEYRDWIADRNPWISLLGGLEAKS